MKFFDLESPIYQFMIKFLQVLKLNFLWIICSLPIVTAGAATVAAYRVTLEMVDETEGYIARPFLKAFRENLKQGSILGMIQMLGMYAIYLDFQLFFAVKGHPIVFLIAGMIAIFILYMGFIYAYPLIARYENSISNTLRNSYKISTKYFLRTLALALIVTIEVLVIFWSRTTIFLGILIGPACIIYTISGFAKFLFRDIENNQEQGRKKEHVS